MDRAEVRVGEDAPRLLDLEEVGLGINQLEKFPAYIVKVGAPVSETIRMDRRLRLFPDGEMRSRLPETWEECHQVLCENCVT